jgi:hypothetical protein
MFGHHHEPAQATVLYAQDVTGQWEERRHSKIEFVLEVHTPTGQTFRAKTTHHFFIFTPYPKVGDVVKVKYDPKSLEATLDLRDDLRYDWKGLQHKEQMQRQAAQAQRDALLSAQPGTPVSSMHSPRGVDIASLDPELQALMDLEEAERRAEQANGQQWKAFMEAQKLHRDLEYTGVSGQAKILHLQQAGGPVQRFVPLFVEVLVQPDDMSSPFECSFTAWIDTSKGMLTEGHIFPVKYDPQHTTRIVFLFPASA